MPQGEGGVELGEGLAAVCRLDDADSGYERDHVATADDPGVACFGVGGQGADERAP